MAVRSRARSILARPVTGYCGATRPIWASIASRWRDDGFDQLAGQGRGGLITLGLREVALEDGVGRALAEVGFEDRGQRQSTSRPSSALAVSLRHHRRRP